ncbi:MAG: glutathione S-transferase N-terminal domain-containing protein [Pseudomonadota bacterium]
MSMKLRASMTSPYARKVRAMLIETGLDKSTEVIDTDPWSPETDLPNDNPLGRVPTLILEDGTSLYDSRTICEILDGMHNGHRLYPSGGDERTDALLFLALGDGMCDTLIHRVVDRRRPENLQSTDWQARQVVTLNRCLDHLEGIVDQLEGPVTIGTLAVSVALGYIDLRGADLNWRANHPKLAAWQATMEQRPSIDATRPPEGA